MSSSWIDLITVTTIAQVSTFARIHALKCLRPSSTACSVRLLHFIDFMDPRLINLLLDDTPYLLVDQAEVGAAQIWSSYAVQVLENSYSITCPISRITVNTKTCLHRQSVI